jgi:hypothetical protein
MMAMTFSSTDTQRPPAENLALDGFDSRGGNDSADRISQPALRLARENARRKACVFGVQVYRFCHTL